MNKNEDVYLCESSAQMTRRLRCLRGTLTWTYAYPELILLYKWLLSTPSSFATLLSLLASGSLPYPLSLSCIPTVSGEEGRGETILLPSYDDAERRELNNDALKFTISLSYACCMYEITGDTEKNISW